MPYQNLDRVVAALKGRGLKVEIVPGAETRGSSAFAPWAILNHWTAGPKTGDRPSLSVCVTGRLGLPGPLCNFFLTRAGVVIIVALGRANHAGAGFYQGADGNTDLWGIEAEMAGPGDDWTAAQKIAYPALNAALMDLGAKFVAGHSEYALPQGRKQDVGTYINTIRANTLALRSLPINNPSKEDDDVAKAIQFESKGVDGKNHVYVAFPNAREYDYAESQGEINDYKNILTRQGFQYEIWKNSKGTANVDNPDVFGRYIGPSAVKPAGAKREG